MYQLGTATASSAYRSYNVMVKAAKSLSVDRTTSFVVNPVITYGHGGVREIHAANIKLQDPRMHWRAPHKLQLILDTVVKYAVISGLDQLGLHSCMITYVLSLVAIEIWRKD